MATRSQQHRPNPTTPRLSPQHDLHNFASSEIERNGCNMASVPLYTPCQGNTHLVHFQGMFNCSALNLKIGADLHTLDSDTEDQGDALAAIELHPEDEDDEDDLQSNTPQAMPCLEQQPSAPRIPAQSASSDNQQPAPKPKGAPDVWPFFNNNEGQRQCSFCV